MVTPLTAKEAVAWMTTRPALVELIWMEHVPDEVEQVDPLTNVAPAALSSRLKVTTVPSGAATMPEPESCWTLATMVWASVIPFTAVGGVRSMRPFTYCLVAGPDPPGPELPDVERWTVTPPIVTSAVAFA